MCNKLHAEQAVKMTIRKVIMLGTRLMIVIIVMTVMMRRVLRAVILTKERPKK